jgi:monoterpene epsilon-lactone hydrolase
MRPVPFPRLPRLGALAAALAMAAVPAGAQTVPGSRTVTVDADGTAHIRDAVLPPSSILSAKGREILGRARPTEGPGAAAQPATPDMAELRRRMNEQLQPNVRHMRDVYPVDIQETTIDGIEVAIITPRGGVPARNRNRLIINAPGGGFRTGIRANGLLISIPVAAVGRFKVVSLLYRQGPEYRFPAATEDFTKVYRAMLKSYRPANIGLVGCSAGGALIAESVAHFQQVGLPRPGVLGIYCSGADAKWMDGDSARFAALATASQGAGSAPNAYFEGMNMDDPAISPVESPAILAKFPPTLFANATRDFSMSRAALSYRRLVNAGVEAQLLIFDGLGHGFMTNPDFPESRELYEDAARFYDRHLAR